MPSEALQPILDTISSSSDETKAQGCDTFSFDIIPLKDQDLCALNWRTLVRHQCDKKFSISTAMYNAFISKVQSLMRPNTYHNFCHVNDVAQTVGCILQDPKCSDYFNELDVFTCIITAIIHDLDHPGNNNAYEVNRKTDLAITYNDISVLENYHCALATKIINECDFLAGLSQEEQTAFRKLMIPMVLHTDMAQHFTLLSNLKDVCQPTYNEEGDKAKGDKKKLVLCEAVLHMADISNPSKPWSVSLEWSNRVFNEFWQQGDLEKQYNLPISMLCDRDNTKQDESQVNFMDFIVAPFLFATAVAFPTALRHLVDGILENRKAWSELIVKRLSEQEGDATEEVNRWTDRMTGFQTKYDEAVKAMEATLA